MDDNDPNFKAAGMGFDDKSIRAGFIRRVYGILSVSKPIETLFSFNSNFHLKTNVLS